MFNFLAGQHLCPGSLWSSWVCLKAAEVNLGPVPNNKSGLLGMPLQDLRLTRGNKLPPSCPSDGTNPSSPTWGRRAWTLATRQIVIPEACCWGMCCEKPRDSWKLAFDQLNSRFWEFALVGAKITSDDWKINRATPSIPLTVQVLPLLGGDAASVK